MTFVEVIGDIVDAMRRRRVAGESASAIVRYLRSVPVSNVLLSRYMDAAFYFPNGRPSLSLLPTREDGSFVDEIVDRALEPVLAESRPYWINEGPYPDLMRSRDRHTFRAVAIATDCIIVVRGADRRNARYIGAPGYRPSPPELSASVRLDEPNRGLMTANPADAQLRSFLSVRFPGKSYTAYVRHLHELGFSVGNAESGFVVRDTVGTMFYPGYYLLGVYKASNQRNAWTGRDGERIRAMLNRQLGADLVQWGPHDIAEERVPGRSSFDGPQTPALFFFPNGNVDTRTTIRDVESLYRSLNIHWNELYKPLVTEGKL